MSLEDWTEKLFKRRKEEVRDRRIERHRKLEKVQEELKDASERLNIAIEELTKKKAK